MNCFQRLINEKVKSITKKNKTRFTRDIRKHKYASEFVVPRHQVIQSLPLITTRFSTC